MDSTTPPPRPLDGWRVGERVRVRFWDWRAPREGTIEAGASAGYYCFRWGPHAHECRELATAYETACVYRAVPRPAERGGGQMWRRIVPVAQG